MEKFQNSFASGFVSQLQETAPVHLPVKGVLPDWLNGQLLRVGPARYEVGDDSCRHWFDGFSMLHRFSFANQQVEYSSKFLQSESYKKALAGGGIYSSEFGTQGRRTLSQRIASIFAPELTDNCNVNLVQIAGHSLALTETAMPVEFDPDTLGTMGRFTFDDELFGHVSTAHPQYDPQTKTIVNLLVRLAKTSQYIFYEIKPGSIKRNVVASIPVASPGYTHSFALTPNYIVLMECPLLLNTLELLFSGKPYIENYHWHGKKNTRFIVIDRSSGSVVNVLETDACFVFHHANAFERDGAIVLDAAVYHNAEVVKALYLDHLRAANPIVPKPKLVRYKLDLNKKAVTAECPHDYLFEFPTINYARCNTRAYEYIYGVAASSQSAGGFLDQLIKLDEPDGIASLWHNAGCYPGEPVFVGAPGGEKEDDGVILSVVFDARASRSFLLVLDAVTFTELARLDLPNYIPFGFHGQFVGSRKAS